MTEASELRAAVRAVGAFRDLSEENLSRLIAAARRHTFEAGEALMTQGESSEHADLILDGEIVVTSDSAHGAIPISRLSAPCLVGEMGALAQLDRTATVRALRRVNSLRIKRSALLEVGLASPTLLIDVIGSARCLERQTKTRLAKQVNELLEERRLKQVEAGRVLGVPQSKVSALANYRLDGFSVEKLIGFLTLLNQDVEILIRPSRDALSPGRVTVLAVR